MYHNNGYEKKYFCRRYKYTTFESQNKIALSVCDIALSRTDQIF